MDNNQKQVKPEVEEKTVDQPEVEETLYSEIGVVIDCVKLNVREAPNPEADALATLDRGTVVLIDEDESTDDFYKISTASSIEGYCMRQFIEV